MRKARVIVTLRCNRKCENCCNTEEVFNEHRILTNYEELLEYDEIMITGGEPMLIPDKVYALVKRLREDHYKGNIYLYSAFYSEDLAHEFTKILAGIDGLHFTVHYEATDRDIVALKRLSKAYFLQRLGSHKSLRLAIDKRLYDKYDFSNIDFSVWDVVRKLQWLDNCPLPQGEELLIYNLEEISDDN